MASTELPHVSIVIVSYNTAAMLTRCLSSIVGARHILSLEVIVVDNASTDGSAKIVREKFPTMRLIENSENVGFGAANNQGVATARGHYVLLLNSDTIVLPGAIEALAAYIEDKPGIALVGPRLIGGDGVPQRSAFRFPTPPILLLEQLSAARFVSVAGQDGQAKRGSHGFSVDWILGACVMGRHSLLKELGPFDADFFMYAEDIDLCYRARQMGWDIRFIPDVTVVHLGGMSTRRDRLRMAVLSTESIYLFYRKHYSPLAIRGAMLIFRAAAAARFGRDFVRWTWMALINVKDEQRRELLEDLRIWTRVFWLRPAMLAPSDINHPDRSRKGNRGQSPGS